MNTKPILTKYEHELLAQLLLMTGREDRLARDPFIDESEIPAIRAIWPELRAAKRNGTQADMRANLFNRLLLNLSIMTVSQEFFDTVFASADFANLKQIAERVNSFRILCMLDFGNFRYGYKKLRRSPLIKQKWEHYFPTRRQATARLKDLRVRSAPIGLKQIGASDLFALGDLTSEQQDKINLARRNLARILDRAINVRGHDFKTLSRTASQLGFSKLTQLIATAAIPGAELLVSRETRAQRMRYREVLLKVRSNCNRVDEDRVDRIQKDGRQNARTYMAMHDLNVYVATSMREPLHFSTNWAFVNELFRSGNLKKVRYFDPTQTFLPNRVQMGLLECLMIKRARLTVYHAQESDTFGKDCEAGVTLAQAKPVVVFVTRLFRRHSRMRALYKVFDGAARRIHREEFVSVLRAKKLLTAKEAAALLIPEKSKSDAIEAVIRKYVPSIIKQIGKDQVETELIRQGYDPPASALSEFTIDKIIGLERRALTFRDVHPLALQASPMDGVARGVIVTRTVADTRKVVVGLLGNTIKYEIVGDDHNWLLVDSMTWSPVRVVTKDPVLTSAFWSEKWGIEDEMEGKRLW